MNKIRLAIASLTASLFLAGCFNSDVDLVKDSVMEFDKTLTIGEALDNWKACEKTSWEQFETQNGKQIVEYTCSRPVALYDIEKISYIKEEVAKVLGQYIKNSPTESQHIPGLDISKIKQYTTTELLEYLYIIKRLRINDDSESSVAFIEKQIKKLTDYQKIVTYKTLSLKSFETKIQFTINKDNTWQMTKEILNATWQDGTKLTESKDRKITTTTKMKDDKDIMGGIENLSLIFIYENEDIIADNFKEKPWISAGIAYTAYTDSLTDTEKDKLKAKDEATLKSIEKVAFEKLEKYEMTIKDDVKKELKIAIYVNRIDYGHYTEDDGTGNYWDKTINYKGFNKTDRDELKAFIRLSVDKLPKLTKKFVDFGSVEQNLIRYNNVLKMKSPYSDGTYSDDVYAILKKIKKLMGIDGYKKKQKKLIKHDNITSLKLKVYLLRLTSDIIRDPEKSKLDKTVRSIITVTDIIDNPNNEKESWKLLDFIAGEGKLPEPKGDKISFYTDKIKQKTIKELEKLPTSDKAKKLIANIKAAKLLGK